MKVLKTVSALGLLAFSSVALASDLPRYDVEGYCEMIASGSHDMFNFCIDEEQKAYDELRTVVSSVETQTLNYCNQIAGDSYDMLLFCIEEEDDAANNRRSFSFD
ncbi:hypothetical protein [Vreelandella alkaliphila]|uniref:hypothetical protein n=1 Tax=Vreelandella alkaliphila TaxID=272774 RepID=UPI003FD8BCE1